MKQRYFGILLLLLYLVGCKQKESIVVSESTLEQRPNIIYIMADDHAKQAISAYGHAVGRLAPTPNIDRIAKVAPCLKIISAQILYVAPVGRWYSPVSLVIAMVFG